jgi:hypothetical protein
MTKAELTSFEAAATGVLRPAFAMAGVANPPLAATLFAIGMVFRALKLRSEIREAEAAAAAALAAGVRKESFLRVPILVADPAAALIARFVDDRLFARKFPDMHEIFEAEIAALGGSDPARVRAAAEVLNVVNRLALPVYANGEPLRFGNPELQRMYGDLVAQSPPDWRRVVREHLLLEKNRNPLNLDVAALADDILQLQLTAASSRLTVLTEGERAKLAAAIRTLVQTELLGNAGAIRASTEFAARRKIEVLTESIAECSAKISALQSDPDGSRSFEAKSEVAALQKQVTAMNAEKAAIEASLRP